jgi:hypothetical protein
LAQTADTQIALLAFFVERFLELEAHGNVEQKRYRIAELLVQQQRALAIAGRRIVDQTL